MTVKDNDLGRRLTLKKLPQTLTLTLIYYNLINLFKLLNCIETEETKVVQAELTS